MGNNQAYCSCGNKNEIDCSQSENAIDPIINGLNSIKFMNESTPNIKTQHHQTSSYKGYATFSDTNHIPNAT